MPATSQRYARQLLLPTVGEAGQARLQAASVLVVGAGGLGSPVLSYLAAAGIGTLGIVEADRVELSNLNRQILYETQDIGRLKAEAARDALHDLNPEIHYRLHKERLTADHASDLIRPYDLVVDATDNYASRDAINTACLQLGKPWVFGAARQWQAQVALFTPGQGPCWRCLVSDLPATEQNACADAGIIGITVGLAGVWQSSAAIATLLGQASGWQDKLLLLDVCKPDSRFVTLKRDPGCPACKA